MTYRNQERWTEAEALQGQVTEIEKTVFEAEHPETLAYIGNIALIYRKLGCWIEAEKQ